MQSNSARPGIFIRRAMCTRCLDVCWRGSLKKYGGRWDHQSKLKFWNSAPAAVCLRGMCWTGQRKSFPNFFVRCTIHWGSNHHHCERGFGDVLTRFLESGRASSVSEGANEGLQVRRPWFPDASAGLPRVRPARDTAESFYFPKEGTGEGTTSAVPNNAMDERALAPEVPVIVFANEFFDALPVEVLSARELCASRQKTADWLKGGYRPSAEELEFLDRYSVHPEAGERIEVPLLAQRYMSQLAASIVRADCRDRLRLHPAGATGRPASWHADGISAALGQLPILTRRRESRTSPRT